MGDLLSLLATEGLDPTCLPSLSPLTRFPSLPRWRLIQSGTLDASNRNVTLYYGTKNEKAMAYVDLIPEWEKVGVKVVPVFSETGMYVQDAFKNAGGVQDAGASCAILCGQKEMAEAVKAIFAQAGVDEERVLTNF